VNDIKYASDAHVWCNIICILKAWSAYLKEWNVRQEFHYARLNEYHGCMFDSIMKSHQSYVLNDNLRGMCSISPGKASINIWKSKHARILCCHDKRKMIMPWGSHENDWEQLWAGWF
jgi:hypothetical protein